MWVCRCLDSFMFAQSAPLGCPQLLASSRIRSDFQLTIIPVLTAMPLPQYVLGTMSPKPTLKNVIAISHIEFNKLACSSSWNLNWIIVRNQFLLLILTWPRQPSWISRDSFSFSLEGSEYFLRGPEQPQKFFTQPHNWYIYCFWSFSTYHHSTAERYATATISVRNNITISNT